MNGTAVVGGQPPFLYKKMLCSEKLRHVLAHVMRITILFNGIKVRIYTNKIKKI